jgi:four helix bundle protein
MTNTQEMAERMTDFAVSVMELYEELPKTFLGRHIGQQLLRAGTAVTANYAEVRGAESRIDFIHKLGIVRKELYECLEWLRLLGRRKLLPASKVEPVQAECDQLCRIICASRKTAEANTRQGKPRY